MRETRLTHRALHSLLSAVLCIVPVTGGTTEADAGIGTLDCVINPSVVADLGSSAPGVLSSVAVDRSDLVQAGDVIAELDSGVESASVELARTRAESTAEIDLRRVNAAYGYRLRDRTKNLFQRNVVSTNDLDERETEARLARIQLRQAKDNNSIAKMEQVRAEELLKRRTIKSPITGVVMERFKVVGEYVEDEPVARVAQLDPLHVEVIVPVEHLGEVAPGMTAEVWTDVVDDTRWLAEVTRVDKVSDVASGTYGVRLSLPNPSYEIPAGLRCRMQLTAQAPKPVAVEAVTEAPVDGPIVGEGTAQPASSDAEDPEPPNVSEPEVVQSVAPTASQTEDPAPRVPAPQPAEPETAEETPETGTQPIVEDAEPADEVADNLPERPFEDVEQVARASVEMEAESQGPPPVAMEERDPEPEVHSVEVAPERDQSVDEGQTFVAEAMAEPPSICRVAGPFKDEVAATRQVVRLRRAGMNVDIKSVAKDAGVELKIMTPVLEDEAAAQEVVAKLDAAGLSDVYLHKMPGGKRRVYLGIYNSKFFARHRVRELEDAGIKAFARPSKASGYDFFLVIRGVMTDGGASLVSELPMTDADQLEQRSFCDKIAGR